ncbi:nitroreductase family protein, partial [Bacteroidota bacterium]
VPQTQGQNEKKKKKIDYIINNSTTGPFGNIVKTNLVSKELPGNMALKLGTYGFINGAKYFIIGIIKNGNNNFLDFGYVFEKIILELSALNIASCWLGGTFKRGEFARTVNLNNDEFIPAISPVGYPSTSRSIKDTLIRMGAGSHKRKSFDQLFFNNSFSIPLKYDDCGEFCNVLEMVRLAPSASNRQPWRIIKEKDSNNFHFYICRDKNYQKIIKHSDLQMIDMGIAMCHFELGAKELGLKGHWKILQTVDNIGESLYLFSWIENI